MVSTAHRSVSGVVPVRHRANQHGSCAPLAKVTSSKKSVTDSARSEAETLDRAINATGTSIAELSRAVGVDRVVIYRWIDQTSNSAPSARHWERMPAPVRLLCKLSLGDIEPAPSLAWGAAQVARISAELVSCAIDGSAREHSDKCIARLIMVALRLWAMR
jgi:hypothetical protein